MGNFKVKVNSEAESNEVQYLFEAIGYERGACSLGDYPAVIVTTQDWATGNYCSTRALGLNNSAHESFKELTLPELRAMVNPSLNDQYAEIGQVLQHKKHERNSSAWDIQIGGDHYKQFHIQPMQFALENKLDAAQQNVIKYIMRHSFKNGKQDLEKAKHYIDLMIEFYYGENNNG